ncbi:MAG TPA: ABC transporter permease [Candidatus Sulfomarinibacteraceae bacterium]|nr:ABC transporter permease [Candidatus Sulfomarinibacteraceae bacterium]
MSDPGGRRDAEQGRAASAVTALLLMPTTAWYLFLLVVPLGILVVFSLGTRTDVGGYAPGLTLQNYLDLPTRWPPFQNTLVLAVLGTVLCALVAYPLAYYLATRAGEKRTILLILVILPFWTSFLIRTYAWLQILGANGIPSFLEALGVEPRPVLLNTHASVLLGIVYNYLPLMVFPLYVSLERLDKRLLEASKDLGANRLRTFLQVTLPLTAPGLVSGGLLVFIPMMGEYIIPTMLGGGKIYFVGNALVDLYLQSRNWPLGSAAAIGLIALVVATVGVYLRLTRVRGGRDVSLI